MRMCRQGEEDEGMEEESEEGKLGGKEKERERDGHSQTENRTV